MVKNYRLQFKEMDKPVKKQYFTSKDIAKIKRNTWNNHDGESYVFIAKKIKSKKEKQFKKINELHDKKGYLDSKLSTRRYKLSTALLKELKKKSPSEYKKVNKVL